MDVIEEGRFPGGFTLTVECSDALMSEILGCTPLHEANRLHPLSYQDAFRKARHPRANSEDQDFEVTLTSGAKVRPLVTALNQFCIISETKGEGVEAENKAYLDAQAGLAELGFLEAINRARVALNRQYALLGYRVKPELMVSLNMDAVGPEHTGS